MTSMTDKNKRAVQLSENCAENYAALIVLGRSEEYGFFLAVKQGNLEFLKYLLEEKGVSANCKDKDGKTPLHWAVACRDPAIIQALLDANADTEARDQDGNTPLHVAVKDISRDEDGLTECINNLLEAGADPDAKDNEGITVLEWAENNLSVKADLVCRMKGDPSSLTVFGFNE